MNFTLRQYQQDFADRIIAGLGQWFKVLACAATGAGKSKTFIYLALRAQSRGFTVLILTESSKIFKQLTEELPVQNISAEVKHLLIEQSKIYIAMAQTLARRPKIIKQLKGQKLLIINDEAHIGTATKLLKQFTTSMLIGFTATPDYEAAKHLPELYNQIIIGAQPAELVNGGYLASYQHFGRVAADLDELKMQSGEFTEQSQERAFETNKVYTGLIHDLKTIPYKKAMVFTASIKHCRHVVEELRGAGINCIEVHSQVDPAIQSYQMAQYTHGAINVAVSVGILTKGWDYPPLDLVILCRATTSLPLYMQMIGRGSRTSPGKEKFIVLDYGSNVMRHGLWDQEVDWGTKWKTAKPKKKKKDGVAPIKFCPECEYALPVSATECPNCGHKFERELPISDEETKLIEFTAVYRTLIGRTVDSLNPQELAIYARIKNKKPYALRIARSHYQSGKDSFLCEYGRAMNYKDGWAHMQTQTITPEPKIEFHNITLR